MTLHEFVALPHRFRWGGQGGDDCLTFCASWIFEAIGIDPAEDVRGTYRSADEAAAMLVAAGGMVAFVDRRLLALGITRTDDPLDGDMGIIVAPAGLDGEMKEIGAIRFGPVWLALGPVGICGKKADFIAAWRVQR